jgi:hypothetical protein
MNWKEEIVAWSVILSWQFDGMTEEIHEPPPSGYHVSGSSLEPSSTGAVPKLNSVALVRKRTIPTERPPHVGEVSANFFADRGCRVVSATDPHGR